MLEGTAYDKVHAAACDSGRALQACSTARIDTSRLVAELSTTQEQKVNHDRSRDVELVLTIRLTALIAFGLATPAMADGAVPEEYQGVWASARDCKGNFQNVLSNIVNREFAACRVTQALSSGHPESHTSTIYLNCGSSQSREIWHAESIEGTDYLVIIQFEQGTEAGRPSIDLYKRCAGIPLSEIPLSEIPGNPVADVASEEKIAPSSRGAQIVRPRPFPHSRAARVRKRTSQ
jgi:hypothetical protein